MTATLLFNHLLNLMAPAGVVALLLVVFSRLLAPFFMPNRSQAHAIIAWTAIIFIVNLVVLLAGLVLWGHDGKMVTYAAMVVVASAVLMAMQRA